MFGEIYDAISFLWSWTWPETAGRVTAVEIERLNVGGSNERTRLAVAFKFSVRDDGPYTGESFWQPAYCEKRRVVAARRKLRVGLKVTVRYRPDDPSVNRLDRRAWRGF